MKVELLISSLVDHSCGTNVYKNSCDYANPPKKQQKKTQNRHFLTKNLHKFALKWNF